MTPIIQKNNEQQTGYKAHCISRGETFSVSHDRLALKDGFNERRIFNGIDDLASRIQHNGFRKTNPITVEWNKLLQIFEVIHGERRFRAVKLLVAQGIDPGPIWCMSESKDTSPLQQLFDQILTNTGEQFTPLEKGRLYLRIQAESPATTGVQIAAKVGETKQAVSNALRLAKHGSNALHAAIEAQRISSTTADSILKEAGEDHAAQDALLTEALAAAKQSGSTHATPKHLPKKQGQGEAKSDSPSSPSSSSTSQIPTLNSQPIFTLYEITDAPQSPLKDGTYHETHRLVLFNLPPGCERLQLLSALTEDGDLCYGYRYNDITLLPDPSEKSSYDTPPDEGFAAILNRVAAFASIFKDPEDPAFSSVVDDALFDALCRYYPEQGNPEEPECLEFVAIPDAPPKESSGYQAIVNAPSSNRDGSSGPGSGGFVSVDRRLKEIETIMEKMADLKDEAKSPDRILTAEILLQVLRNESPLSRLQDHLKGK